MREIKFRGIRYVGEKYSNGITNAEWQYRTIVIGNIYENPDILN